MKSIRSLIRKHALAASACLLIVCVFILTGCPGEQTQLESRIYLDDGETSDFSSFYEVYITESKFVDGWGENKMEGQLETIDVSGEDWVVFRLDPGDYDVRIIGDFDTAPGDDVVNDVEDLGVELDHEEAVCYNIDGGHLYTLTGSFEQ
jgi:hypothetical protein